MPIRALPTSGLNARVRRNDRLANRAGALYESVGVQEVGLTGSFLSASGRIPIRVFRDQECFSVGSDGETHVKAAFDLANHLAPSAGKLVKADLVAVPAMPMKVVEAIGEDREAAERHPIFEQLLFFSVGEPLCIKCFTPAWVKV